jgi:hypothetical protein
MKSCKRCCQRVSSKSDSEDKAKAGANLAKNAKRYGMQGSTTKNIH